MSKNFFKIIIIFLFLFVFYSKNYSNKSDFNNREILVINIVNKSNNNWNWLSNIFALLLSEEFFFLSHLDVYSFLDRQYFINFLQNNSFDFLTKNISKTINIKNKSNFLRRRFLSRFCVFGEFYIIKKNRILLKINLKDMYYNKIIYTIEKKSALNKLFDLFKKVSYELSLKLEKFDQIIKFDIESFMRYQNFKPQTNQEFLLYSQSFIYFAKENYIKSIKKLKILIIKNPKCLSALLLLAKSYFMLGNIWQAKKIYEKSYNISFKNDFKKHFTFIAIFLAEVYQLIGHHEKSLWLYNKIISLNYSDKFILAFVYYHFGIFRKNHGYYERAKANLWESFRISKALKYPKITANVIFELAHLNYICGKYVIAFKAYSKALNLYFSKGLLRGLYNSYLHLAELKRSKSNYKESFNLYSKAQEIANTLEWGFSITKSFLGKASVMELLDKFIKAKDYIYRSIIIQKKLSDFLGLASSYNILGSIYLEINDINKSLKYQKKALNIHTKKNIKISMAKDFSYISVIYNKLKNYKKARLFYKNALNIYKQIKNPIGVAFIKNSLAFIDFKENANYNKVLKVYRESIKIMIAKDYTEGIALSYLMMAFINNQKGEYLKALNYYKKAKQIFFKIGHPNFKNILPLISLLEKKISK